MNNYTEWRAAYPAAAADLERILTSNVSPPEGDAVDKSEAWSQQQARFKIAQGGAFSWRNNVGAIPAKCKECNAPQYPIRYGIANDSPAMNVKIKSADLTLAIPRTIRPEHVGSVILQFGGLEMKKPGWVYRGTAREQAQAAWLTFLTSRGGYGEFSTGEVVL